MNAVNDIQIVIERLDQFNYQSIHSKNGGQSESRGVLQS